MECYSKIVLKWFILLRITRQETFTNGLMKDLLYLTGCGKAEVFSDDWKNQIEKGIHMVKYE